jgi:hypothetical protein
MEGKRLNEKPKALIRKRQAAISQRERVSPSLQGREFLFIAGMLR